MQEYPEYPPNRLGIFGIFGPKSIPGIFLRAWPPEYPPNIRAIFGSGLPEAPPNIPNIPRIFGGGGALPPNIRAGVTGV